MQRRKNSEEKNIKISTSKKKDPGNRFIMRLGYLKICFAVVIIISIMACLYLYTRAPGQPPPPRSPEMEALLKEHGPGEAKSRRRPDLNQEIEKETSNEMKEENSKHPDTVILDETEKRDKEYIKDEDKSYAENQDDKEIDTKSKEANGVAFDDELLRTVASNRNE